MRRILTNHINEAVLLYRRNALLLGVGMLFCCMSSFAVKGGEAGSHPFWVGDDGAALQTKTLKGFFDFGVLAETKFKKGSKNEDKLSRFEFSASYGYLFNPRAFLGLGVGFHLYPQEDAEEFDYSLTEIPIFIHYRGHAFDRNITPFVDLRLGYFVRAIYGLYFSPSVGCRFRFEDFFSMYVSLGYSINNIEKSVYGLRARSESVSIRIGIDF